MSLAIIVPEYRNHITSSHAYSDRFAKLRRQFTSAMDGHMTIRQVHMAIRHGHMTVRHGHKLLE